MRHTRAWAILLLCLLFPSPPVFSELIKLDDGTEYNGKIMIDTGTEFGLKTIEGKIVFIKKKRIKSSGLSNNMAEYCRHKLEEMHISFSPEEFIQYVKAGDADVVGYFLLAGMSPNTRDQDGNPALVCAVRSDQITVAEKLIYKSPEIRASWPGVPILEAVNVNARSVEGETPLMLAAKNGQPEFVELLLKEAAKANAKNADGYTALMLAVENGRIDAVKLLMKKGADANARTADGKTLSMLAETEGHNDVAEILSENSKDSEFKARQKEWIKEQKAKFPSNTYIPLLWRDFQEDEFITEKFNAKIVRPALKLTGYTEGEVDPDTIFRTKWIEFPVPREVPPHAINASIIIDNTNNFNCIGERLKKALGSQIDLSYSEAGFSNLDILLGKLKTEESTLVYHGDRFGPIESIAYIEFGEEATSIKLTKPVIKDRFVACWEQSIQASRTPSLDDVLKIKGICEHMNACRRDPSIDIRFGKDLLDKLNYEIDEERRVLVLSP